MVFDIYSDMRGAGEPDNSNSKDLNTGLGRVPSVLREVACMCYNWYMAVQTCRNEGFALAGCNASFERKPSAGLKA